MEDKVKNLELAVIELKSDFKVMTQTLKSIDETLKELKSVHSVLHKIEMQQVGEDRDILTVSSKVEALFRFKDITEKRLRELEKSGSVQSVKLGGGEKLFWLGASAVIGLVIAYIKGGV